MNSLEEAYRNTNYTVNIESKIITINIGRDNPEWTQFLKLKNQTFYFYITAWNPFSEITSPEKNEEANKKLKERLISLGLLVYDGVGYSADMKWHEDSFSALGGNRDLAYQLGKEFRQNAIVIGNIGELPELLYTNK
jgi:hypothetical protein